MAAMLLSDVRAKGLQAFNTSWPNSNTLQYECKVRLPVLEDVW